MKSIEIKSNESQDSMCVECDNQFEDLEIHMMSNHVTNRRNGRAFSYNLNEKRAKGKLLKGAMRLDHLNVEVKSGCVNLRFSDGSYFEVVLPVLREWHGNVGKSLKLNDIDIKIDEADPGIDKSDRHIDTKLEVFANNERLVLHAYNGTQNLMVQGKNYESFALNYLEPYFTQKIGVSLENIEKFNRNVKEMLGKGENCSETEAQWIKTF